MTFLKSNLGTIQVKNDENKTLLVNFGKINHQLILYESRWRWMEIRDSIPSSGLIKGDMDQTSRFVWWTIWLLNPDEINSRWGAIIKLSFLARNIFHVFFLWFDLFLFIRRWSFRWRNFHLIDVEGCSSKQSWYKSKSFESDSWFNKIVCFSG
jgi:hypothetical protein